jgi:hypothetical protein
MKELPPFGVAAWLGLLLVVAAAGAARAGYLMIATDNGVRAPALVVQGTDRDLEALIKNIESDDWFGSKAPLAEQEETTAHVAPGYPWLVAALARLPAEPGQAVRWLQCVLGALAAGCCFLFARRAFHSGAVALLAGLFAAVHPYWVVVTAEIADGAVVSFLLAACLAAGTRSSQIGGAFTSLIFGLLLAALAMVRAALLPFALVAMLWFLWRCRHFRWGWFAALLCLLGFGNGLAPWGVRNYRVYGVPLPVVSSAYLHAWAGNNARATGGPLAEETLRASLPDERWQALVAETNQARRYAMLSRDLRDEVQGDPAAAVERRLTSAQAFLLGQAWLEQRQLGLMLQGDSVAEPPSWLREHFALLLGGSLLAMLTLALLGWRWSYAWGWHAWLATLALLWIPLPYILGHAEALSGPRLPLDGVLLCYAAYALCAWLPGQPRTPDAVSPTQH